VYSDPRDGARSDSSDDPDSEPVGGMGERQRAAIALGALAIVALVVVVIMVAVLGSSDGSPAPTTQAAGPAGPAVTVTGGAGPSTAPSPTTKRATHPTRPSPRPSTGVRTGPVSCPTSSPCAVPDDIGDAVGALNAYRTAHGKKPVRGQVTDAATRCALNSGNSCPGGYFWEPVGRSGQQVVQKIAAMNDGTSWLLDDKMTAVQVGWAYVPASHSFECVLISNA
jgi:hypothetical protein